MIGDMGRGNSAKKFADAGEVTSLRPRPSSTSPRVIPVRELDAGGRQSSPIVLIAFGMFAAFMLRVAFGWGRRVGIFGALLLACFSQSLSLVEWITPLLQGPGPRSRTFWGKAMKSKLHPRFH
jgi:hypothetical protein